MRRVVVAGGGERVEGEEDTDCVGFGLVVVSAGVEVGVFGCGFIPQVNTVQG